MVPTREAGHDRIHAADFRSRDPHRRAHGRRACVRYLRHEIAADIGPRLRRLQLQLDNLESAVNLALVTRYADLGTPRGAPSPCAPSGFPRRAVIAMPARPRDLETRDRRRGRWRTAALVTAGSHSRCRPACPGGRQRPSPPPGAVADLFRHRRLGVQPTAAGGEPPSDPGPVFVRQQVVELFSEVLADLGQATGQQVGVVTFGTDLGTQIGPLAISAPATRSSWTPRCPALCGLRRLRPHGRTGWRA